MKAHREKLEPLELSSETSILEPHKKIVEYENSLRGHHWLAHIF